MSYEVTGKLHKKYDTKVVNEKYSTREFIVQVSEEINGKIYVNYAKMQLVNNSCEIIDRYNEGDEVRVMFNIKGHSHIDKKDGIEKYVTNLNAWRVEKL